MNVNVRLSKTLFCFVVLLVFDLSSVCHTIIQSSFGRLRNGWGIRPANHFYQCDGLKTSGSRFSLEVESVVSSYWLSIFWFTNLLSNMVLLYYSIIEKSITFQGPFLLIHPIRRLRPRKRCLEWCYTMNPYTWQISSWHCKKYDYPTTTQNTATTVTSSTSTISSGITYII